MFDALIGRARRLLLSTSAEWAAIDAEPADMQAIYRNYSGPLIVASALASAIGTLLFGFGGRMGMAGFVLRPSIFYVLEHLISSVVIGLAGVYVMALIIDALAPSFGGVKNFGQAFKVSAYFPTAAWVAGLGMIVPQLAPLVGLASLYSLYLLYAGLPLLMKTGEGKGLIYVIAVLACALVLGIVVFAFLGLFGFGFW
jgi:hypothetical protein